MEIRDAFRELLLHKPLLFSFQISVDRMQGKILHQQDPPESQMHMSPDEPVKNVHYLVDVSDIFYFFCSGEGKGGESEVPGEGGGDDFFIENPRGGGVLPGGGGRGGREAGRVSAGNLGGG